MNQPQKNLAHKKFDFSQFNAIGDSGYCFSHNGCRTNGCMAGELPAIFPRSWEWVGSQINLKSSMYCSTKSQLGEFFGIEYWEAAHLFYPGDQINHKTAVEGEFYDPKGSILYTNASKREVVANLRRFLKIKNIL